MKSSLTIGNFDGVHRGHRKLIEAVTHFKRLAATSGETLESVVLTFEPHPIEVLRAPQTVKRLSTLEAKIELIEQMGIDKVDVIDFTLELAKTEALDFFNTFIVKAHDPKFIAVGPNFYFGHSKSGTPALLQQWSLERGIQCEIISGVEADGDLISSTRIRRLIEEGQLIQASRLLGRDYSISGEVVHGAKKGRLLGFPTANILPKTDGIGALALPANGVYLTTATVDGRTFASITNIGVKPTVQKSGPVIIETHLLDFDGDLYGKSLTVEFRDRLRGELKFSNLEELSAQIRKDTDLARLRLRNG